MMDYGDRLFASENHSPCIGVCELGDDKICVGCGRSIAQIAAWSQMTDRERQAILDRLRADRPGIER